MIFQKSDNKQQKGSKFDQVKFGKRYFGKKTEIIKSAYRLLFPQKKIPKNPFAKNCANKTCQSFNQKMPTNNCFVTQLKKQMRLN